MRRVIAPGVAILALLWSLGASAQDEYSFADFPVDASQWHKEDFAPYSVKPFKSDALAYQLLIPREWKPVEQEVPARVSYGAPVPLGSWRGADFDTTGAEIMVSYVVLPFEQEPMDWMKHVAAQCDFDVMDDQEVRVGERPLAELLMRVSAAGDERIVRWAGIADEERLFLVTTAAKAGHVEKHARQFAAAIYTFKLLHPAQAADLQGQACEIATPFKIGLEVPVGWTVTPGQAVPDAHGYAYLYPPEGGTRFVLGRIHLAGSEAECDPREARALAVRAFQKSGFKNERVALDLPVAQRGLPPGRFVLYVGDTPKGHRELFVYTAAREDSTVTLSVYTTAYEDDPDAWRLARKLFWGMVQGLTWPE